MESLREEKEENIKETIRSLTKELETAKLAAERDESPEEHKKRLNALEEEERKGREAMEKLQIEERYVRWRYFKG